MVKFAIDPEKALFTIVIKPPPNFALKQFVWSHGYGAIKSYRGYARVVHAVK